MRVIGQPEDRVLLDDWHPVAACADLPPGKLVAVRLIGREVVLWRGADGGVRAWDDRCPHRGTRLSIGRIFGDEVVCAYHGWHFDGSARCTLIPALTNFVQSEDELRAFQDRIFLQDKPVLENQVPRRLPLDPGTEMPVRCDRMSLAYRRYLRDKALRYGVVSSASVVRS